jgi:enoyl-CoA hydratase/carnithine racemase
VVDAGERMTSTTQLEYTVSDRIATITLARPERKNAFTLEMIDAWLGHLNRARHDDGVRVIVLTGAGDAFCSGMDLTVMQQTDSSPIGRKRLLTDRVRRIGLALDDLDKPTIAAINGVAVGAGLDMALLCDLRVAARSARMSAGYIKVGLVPGDGAAWLLPRLVGPAKAMELLLTGDVVTADEALRLGLVGQVVADGELTAQARLLAAKIAAAPPIQIAMIRRLIRQADNLDLRTHFDLVSSHMGVVASLAVTAEAVAALQERRTGRFIGA